MASTSREDAHSTTNPTGTAAKAPLVAMDAKLLEGKGPEDCKQLKELVQKENPLKMMVVFASTNQDQALVENPADDRAPAVMNPLLLAAACFGSSRILIFLFAREDAREQPSTMSATEFFEMLAGKSSSAGRRSTRQQASDEIEEGINGAPLLEGVTIEGDTALHVLASHGDNPVFLECASIIYDRAKHLLFTTNKNGDTPLHCAARAGKSHMVFHLINRTKDGDETDQTFKVLLRKENDRKETVLHDAIRVGDDNMVGDLMKMDPQLACFPKQGISPLYLAVLLGNSTIAATLRNKSGGNLSYSGPDGKNALHAAVLGDEGESLPFLSLELTLCGSSAILPANLN